jgi:uncharacterized protein
MIVEMEVSEICRTSEFSAVVLKEKDGAKRQFPIYIGQFEGEALEIAIHRHEMPRPFTHDLILNVIRDMGGNLKRVIIDRLDDNTFFSKLEVETASGETVLVDSRPSDAMVLATKTSCAIYADEQVLEDCHASPSGEPEDDSE